MEINKPIKRGLDTNILIYLSIYNDPRFDPQNLVHDLIEKKALFPSLFALTPKKSLPPILKNAYLGQIETNEDGRDFYSNLLDIARLDKLIKEGVVEAYVSPTVQFEVVNENTIEYMDNYCKRLQVNKEDSAEFFGKRWELANLYAEKGAIAKKRDAVTLKERIIPDACLTAEYSLFGLEFLTANQVDLIHRNPSEEDYAIADAIQQINKAYGLTFVSNNGKPYSPKPNSVYQFTSRVKKYMHGINLFIDFNKSNIDKDNHYIPYE